jgi:D-inositol-3-phosphate glycosyltransferase
MRIAMVSEHASPLATLGGADAGGQNVHVAALAGALAALGDEVVVHTRRDDPSLPDEVAIAPGVVVHHVDAGPPRPVPKDDLLPHMGAFGEQLRQQWIDRRPDVVHSHFWMSGLASLAAARPLGIPVAHTFHALGVVKRRYQAAADTSPPERLGVERRIAQQVDRIIATCTDEIFELRRLGAPAERLAVVPCGVDLDSFDPTGDALLPPHPRRIVSVGRLVERKGVDDLLRSVALLPRTELVIAGGPDADAFGDDPDSAHLLQLADRLGVTERVRFVGRVSREQVPPLLRSATVVVCVPWYEPFGIVPLEAMACGRPVVASAVGGLVDTVVDGVTGVHVPPRRPEHLARVLGRLLAHPAEARSLGAAGRDRVEARYGWASIARSTREVYAELVPSTRRLSAVTR